MLQWLLEYYKEVQPLLEAPQRTSRSSAAIAGGFPPTDIIHAIVWSMHLQRALAAVVPEARARPCLGRAEARTALSLLCLQCLVAHHRVCEASLCAMLCTA
jgi:hypothetical protein